MFKLLFQIFLFPFKLMIWCVKALFWVPLILIGLIFDDGPGPGWW